jgi:methylenetetrahydrofolate reductase (NADPH)
MSRSPSTASDTATRELLDGYSFEMTGKYVPELEQARRLLPSGTRVTVTFLAGEDLELRVSAAKAVKDLGFVPVPHLPARRLDSAAELEEFLDRLQQIGATEHVFALGGDPTDPSGPYPDALSIIRSGCPSG